MPQKQAVRAKFGLFLLIGEKTQIFCKGTTMYIYRIFLASAEPFASLFLRHLRWSITHNLEAVGRFRVYARGRILARPLTATEAAAGIACECHCSLSNVAALYESEIARAAGRRALKP